MNKWALLVVLLAFVFCLDGEESIFAQQTSTTEQLKEIKELYDSGVINDEEYEQLRNNLILRLDQESSGSSIESTQFSAGEKGKTSIKKYDLSRRTYIGGGVIYAIPTFSDELDYGNWDGSLGFDIKVGGFFTNCFALEGMVHYLTEFKNDDWDGKVSGGGVFINGKGFIPLESAFRPYGVFGLGYGWGRYEERSWYWGTYKEDESGVTFRFGAGFNIILSDDFALEGEITYNLGTGDIDNIKYISIAMNALVFL